MYFCSMKYLSLTFFLTVLFFSCSQKEELPKYSKATIPGTYVNQNGETITGKDLEGNIVVADFVFTHCPSICPRMAEQMLRVQEEFSDKDDLRLISFSIDPARDTVGRLKWYTQKIGTNDDVWSFVRAEKEVVRETSDSLMVFQEKDENAPGGFNHASQFILMDKDGIVRGYYDGVKPEDVSELIEDIHTLYQ